MRAALLWFRRRAWRLAYLVVLAWIAIELHQLTSAVDAIDTSDLNGVVDKLDDISQSIDAK